MKNELTYRELFHNNLIIIVNGIPDGELQSAKRVAENIKDHFQAIQDPGSCHYERISTADELRNIFRSLEHYCSKENAYPVLHIEAHGKEKVGLDICGETITWAELHEMSMRVNILAKNNFGLVLACCYGYEITELVKIDSPCPFRFVLGPRNEVEAGVIEDQTTKFYKEVISSGELNRALSHVEEKFVHFMSSKFLLTSMAHFFGKHTSGKYQAELRETILTKILEEKSNTKQIRKMARSRIKAMLKNPEKFIIQSMRTFLHGEAPVNYAELRSFYTQIKF